MNTRENMQACFDKCQSLGIKRIPIDIILISAQFLVERVARWQLWSNSAMVRAVNEVLSATMADFSTR